MNDLSKLREVTQQIAARMEQRRIELESKQKTEELRDALERINEAVRQMSVALGCTADEFNNIILKRMTGFNGQDK